MAYIGNNWIVQSSFENNFETLSLKNKYNYNTSSNNTLTSIPNINNETIVLPIDETTTWLCEDNSTFVEIRIDCSHTYSPTLHPSMYPTAIPTRNPTDNCPILDVLIGEIKYPFERIDSSSNSTDIFGVNGSEWKNVHDGRFSWIYDGNMGNELQIVYNNNSTRWELYSKCFIVLCLFVCCFVCLFVCSFVFVVSCCLIL